MRVLRSEDKKQHDSPHTYREAIPQGGDAADGEQRVVGGVEGGELHFLQGLVGYSVWFGNGWRDRWVLPSGLPNRGLLDVKRERSLVRFQVWACFRARMA